MRLIVCLVSGVLAVATAQAADASAARRSTRLAAARATRSTRIASGLRIAACSGARRAPRRISITRPRCGARGLYGTSARSIVGSPIPSS